MPGSLCAPTKTKKLPRLKKILFILLINILIHLTFPSTRAEGIDYQFDWNLEPLKYEDNQFYIERILDLRPENEKKVEPDPNRPVFLDWEPVFIMNYSPWMNAIITVAWLNFN